MKKYFHFTRRRNHFSGAQIRYFLISGCAENKLVFLFSCDMKLNKKKEVIQP